MTVCFCSPILLLSRNLKGYRKLIISFSFQLLFNTEILSARLKTIHNYNKREKGGKQNKIAALPRGRA